MMVPVITNTSESLETIDNSLTETVLERYDHTLATLTMTTTNQSQANRQTETEEPDTNEGSG